MCNCRKNKPASPAVSSVRKATVNAPAANIPIMSADVFHNNRTVSMTEIPGDTLEDKCQAFSCLFGLDKPVSEKVLIAAVEDAAYARSLITAKEDLEKLNELIQNPPEQAFQRGLKAGRSFSNAALIAKASRALVKWGASGFSTVTRDVLEIRENACLACPHLTNPESVLQRITARSLNSNDLGHRTGNKVCGLCGCVVKNKMRLATDTCPDRVSETSELNRWGEKISAA
jgi:hypothetical protein